MNLTNFDQLVRALREGDPAPVEAFLRLHEPPLRHVIRMRLRRSSLGRHLDSADVCQSILRIFLRRAEEGRLPLRTPEEVRAFLLAMAANKIRTYARKLRREAGPLPENWDAPSRSPAPVDRLADAELARRARDLLSPEERELFEQHRVLGQTFAEIAARRRESADAVRARLNRALAAVRARLAPEG